MKIDATTPERAPKRPDLTFLRHRSRPTVATNSALADFLSGRARRSPDAGRTAPIDTHHAVPPARPPAPINTQHAAAQTRPPAQQTPAPPPRPAAPQTRPAAAQAPAATRSQSAAAAQARPAGSDNSLDLFAPAVNPPPTPGDFLDLSAPSAPSQAASSSLDLSAPSTPSSTTGNSLDLSAPSVPGPQPPADNSLDLFAAPSQPAPAPARPSVSAPASSSTSLDLGGPSAASAQRAPAQSSGSTSLDLGETALLPPAGSGARRPAAPAGSSSLDLSPSVPQAPQQPVRSQPIPTAVPGSAPGRQEPRTKPGVPTILTVRSPIVVLTRVQSGVGTLTFEAVTSAAVGDFRLGCAYQLRSGRSSTVQDQAGRSYAPPGERRRPILQGSRAQFEKIAVDLRQITELERFVVYGFSGDGGQLRWGGTIVVSTFGGDRIELPIELAPSNAVAVLASVYNVRGQLVVRSEMDLIGTSVREACRGYGFDRITWLDDVTPVD